MIDGACSRACVCVCVLSRAHSIRGATTGIYFYFFVACKPVRSTFVPDQWLQRLAVCPSYQSRPDRSDARLESDQSKRNDQTPNKDGRSGNDRSPLPTSGALCGRRWFRLGGLKVRGDSRGGAAPQFPPGAPAERIRCNTCLHRNKRTGTILILTAHQTQRSPVRWWCSSDCSWVFCFF